MVSESHLFRNQQLPRLAVWFYAQIFKVTMQPMPYPYFNEPNGRSQMEIEKRFNEAEDDR